MADCFLFNDFVMPNDSMFIIFHKLVVHTAANHKGVPFDHDIVDSSIGSLVKVKSSFFEHSFSTPTMDVLNNFHKVTSAAKVAFYI